MPATLLSRHVTAFLNCAREGSFTKAASMMFISPTALIAQIDLFEARLGFKLFERTHRGLRLTPSGESLYADALHLESAARGAVRRAFDLSLRKTAFPWEPLPWCREPSPSRSGSRSALSFLPLICVSYPLITAPKGPPTSSSI